MEWFPKGLKKLESGWVFALLLVATLFIYGRSLGFDYLNWDDDTNIYKNPLILNPSLHSIQQFWQSAYKYFYMPVTYSIWTAISAISPQVSTDSIAHGKGPSPFLFHLVNLLCHCFNAWLVFQILPKLRPKLSKKYALVGAFLFLVHPFQVEPVVWISGLRDILFSLFCLSALWAYLSFGENQRSTYYGMALASFCLGLLSKPTAVVAVPLCGFCAWWFQQRPWKRIFIELAPWALCCIPLAIYTRHLQADAITQSVPIGQRPLLALASLGFYLYKGIVAIPMSMNYGWRPKDVIQSGELIFWVLLALYAGSLVLRAEKQRKLWIGVAGLFVLPLLPVLGLLENVSQNESITYNRYLYLPMLGASFALAVLISQAKSHKASSIPVVVALFALVAMQQARSWRDTESLFLAEMKAYPHSEIGYFGLGLYYGEVGQTRRGIAALEKAAQVAPERTRAAEAAFVFKNYSSQDLVALAHGKVAKREGDYGRAYQIYRRLVQKFPEDTSALDELGQLAFVLGRYEECVQIYQDLFQTLPKSRKPAIANNLGGCLIELGRKEDALKAFTFAVAKDPQDNLYRENLKRARQRGMTPEK